MSYQTSTTRLERTVAAAAGACVCLVVAVAMFTASDQTGQAVSSSPGFQMNRAACDGGFLFTAENILGLCVIGLVAGTFGGMLGMGGGVLKMSFLLLLFGFHPGISKFAALLSYFVVAAGASYQYLKLRLVDSDAVKVLIFSSILGVVLGATIGHHLSRDVLTLLLGVFLLLMSVVMVKKILAREEATLPEPGSPDPLEESDDGSAGRPSRPTPSGWMIALCGFPGGLLSAMLGISGGVVSNPLQQVLARMPIKNAIANTLAMSCVTVPFACLAIMVMGVEAGHFDVWSPMLAAMCLIPGSIIGSQIGPALMKRMSPTVAHAIFGVVAFLMGVNMLFFSA